MKSFTFYKNFESKESDVILRLFKLFLNCAVSLGYLKTKETNSLSYLIIASSNLDNLIDLFKKNRSLETVMLILSGDVRFNDLEKELNNERAMRYKKLNISAPKRTDIPKTILFLPRNFAPEALMYYILAEYIQNPGKYFEFWRSFQNTHSVLITSDVAIGYFKIDDNTHFQDIHKKGNSWANKALKFFEDTNILTDYCKNVDNSFIKQFSSDFQKSRREILESV